MQPILAAIEVTVAHPAEPLVCALRVKIGSSSCLPSLHPLKVRSLRQSRSGSTVKRYFYQPTTSCAPTCATLLTPITSPEGSRHQKAPPPTRSSAKPGPHSRNPSQSVRSRKMPGTEQLRNQSKDRRRVEGPDVGRRSADWAQEAQIDGPDHGRRGTTTEAVPRAIQHSQESLRALAKRHPRPVATFRCVAAKE